jgi:glutamate racemase
MVPDGWIEISRWLLLIPMNSLLHPTHSQSPIGVFDSGVGGLSVLIALKLQLPGEAFIYVADSGNAPYGDRSSVYVIERTRKIADFLVSQGAKALVVACNTASVLAVQKLRAEHSIPIIAMEPAIKPATLLTKSKVVLVLGTTKTISSDSVALLCQKFGAGINIILQACPGLAERVDQGTAAHPETRRLLESYLRPGLIAGADTIVLGCSHYQFLANEIAAIAGATVQLVDPAPAVARELVRRLAPRVMNPVKATGVVFYTSGSIEALSSFLSSVGESNPYVFNLPNE